MSNSTMQARTVRSVHTAFHTLEGDGFEVRRAIPAKEFEAVGPFIFLDHFGPIDVKPGEAKGASAHPHAGIETLTLLLDGISWHKDSLGNVSSMRPGEVQWLRAGRGVIHDESPDDEMRRNGGWFHGVQLWINIPKASKHDDPSYRHVKASEIPVLETPNGNGRTRLVAGHLDQHVGPIVTTGAPFVAHTTLLPSGAVALAPRDVDELAVYVLVGSASVSGQTIQAGQIGRLSLGSEVQISSRGGAELIVVGGDPLDAPIYRYGPFVMNSAADLERAMRDYQSGRMGTLRPTN
ncbi:pirin family protein [Burkholderia sp. Bp9142]|uniref:pirin family protein n=1 Tax=Burkholderia sp. Bp9142 TaxID=2184573 RepID=UPI000F5AEA16|nr:pirin family protein [Burkholderia sp. Bp9142]RQR27544.1 pirin family protein [Burkholderia sp. Bp9142]